MTPRTALHRAAVHRVARRLRRHGHTVVIRLRHAHRATPGDLWVDGRLWALVRADGGQIHVVTADEVGRRLTISAHVNGRLAQCRERACTTCAEMVLGAA